MVELRKAAIYIALILSFLSFFLVFTLLKNKQTEEIVQSENHTKHVKISPFESYRILSESESFVEIIDYDTNEKIVYAGKITVKAPYNIVCRWSNASDNWKECEVVIEVNNSDTKNDLILKGDSLIAKFLKDVKDFSVETTYDYILYNDSILNRTCYEEEKDNYSSEDFHQLIENKSICYYNYTRKQFYDFQPTTKLDKIYKNSVVGIKLKFKSPIAVEAGQYLRNHFNFTLLSDYNITLDPEISDCAVLDGAGQTYYLTGNIIDSSSTYCMYISADNIVLDCQGYTIDGLGNSGTYAIHLSSRTNITVRNCNITDWNYGIYIYVSKYGNFINNTLMVHPEAYTNIYVYSESNNNTFIDNKIYKGYNGVIVSYSSNNSFINGSIHSSSRNFYLAGASATNIFINTNFTGSRTIYFSDSQSWFSYNNRTDLDLWLKTSVSATAILTRNLFSWQQTNITWTEQASATVTARYNLTGLLPNAIYNVTNSSGTHQIPTDSSGSLSFLTQLTTTAQTISVYYTGTADNPPYYSFNSTNSTLAGTAVSHNLFWQDDFGLSHYIFSFDNCTGTFVNDTIPQYSSYNFSPTKTINISGYNTTSPIYLNVQDGQYYNVTMDYATQQQTNAYNYTSPDQEANTKRFYTTASQTTIQKTKYYNTTLGASVVRAYGVSADAQYVTTTSYKNFASATAPTFAETFGAPPYNFTQLGYTRISASDNAYANLTSSGTNYEPFGIYNFTIQEDKSTINWIYIELEQSEATSGSTGTGEYCYYGVANWSSSTWFQFGTYVNGQTDTTRTYNFTTQTLINQFVNGNNVLSMINWGANMDASEGCRIDFVQVRVNYNETSYTPAYEQNSTSYIYDGIDGDDYQNVDRVGAIITIDYYNPSASNTTYHNNNRPDIEVAFWDGSAYSYNTTCQIYNYMGSNLPNSTDWNCTIYKTDSNLLNAWKNQANRRIAIRALWLDAENSVYDEINVTGVYGYVDGWNGTKFEFSGNPTSAWSNVTVVINSTVGCTIRWRIYTNDTSNNWNASEIFSYITIGGVTLEERIFSIQHFLTTQTMKLQSLTKTTQQSIKGNQSISKRISFSKSTQTYLFNSLLFSRNSRISRDFSSNIVNSISQFRYISLSKILQSQISEFTNFTKSISLSKVSETTISQSSEFERSFSLIKSLQSNLVNTINFVKQSSFVKSLQYSISSTINFIKEISLIKSLSISVKHVIDFITGIRNVFESLLEILIFQSHSTIRRINIVRDIENSISSSTEILKSSSTYRYIHQTISNTIIFSRISSFISFIQHSISNQAIFTSNTMMNRLIDISQSIQTTITSAIQEIPEIASRILEISLKTSTNFVKISAEIFERILKIPIGVKQPNWLITIEENYLDLIILLIFSIVIIILFKNPFPSI